MWRLLYILVQVLFIVGIFGFLFWSAVNATDNEGNNVFTALQEQPKRWHFLVAAFFAQLLGLSLTIIRWRWLVLTLGLEISRREAFRLGFLGYVLQLILLGPVGGDAVKAAIFAKRNPNNMSKAVASIFIDRFIGLVVMFLCAAFFILYTGFHSLTHPTALFFTYLTFALTVAALLGSAIVFHPFFSKGYLERMIEKIPFCGKLFSSFVQALLLYRDHKRVLLKCCFITIFVHMSFGLSLYWAAIGLFTSVPSFVEHIMLHSIANLTAMLPIAVGPYEFVLEQIYQLQEVRITGMGFVVSLMYRLTTIFVAIAAVAFYYAAKRK